MVCWVLPKWLLNILSYWPAKSLLFFVVEGLPKLLIAELLMGLVDLNLPISSKFNSKLSKFPFLEVILDTLSLFCPLNFDYLSRKLLIKSSNPLFWLLVVFNYWNAEGLFSFLGIFLTIKWDTSCLRSDFLGWLKDSWD